MAGAVELGDSGASSFAFQRMPQPAASWLSKLEPREAEGLAGGHTAGRGECKETKAQRGYGAYHNAHS